MDNRTPVCHAFLLGAPRLKLDGQEIEIRLKRAAALLYYLLVQKQASREEIVNLIWPREEPELGKRHLRDVLHRLRNHYGAELVVSKGKTELHLNPNIHFLVDVDEFRAAGPEAVYQGEFLKGFFLDGADEFEQWVTQMRSSMQELYLRRLKELARRAGQAGETAQAEQYWRRYLEEEPVSEEAAAALMELYRERRDYNRAATVYRSLHNTLESWLGITPLKETSALYYAIMDEWNRAAEDSEVGGQDFLIGRWDLFQQMARPFNMDSPKLRPRSMVLIGEAGVGKSHLLNYFLKNARLEQWTVVTASCFKSHQREQLHPWQVIMASLHTISETEGIKIPKALAYIAASLFPIFYADIKQPPSMNFTLNSGAAYEGVLSILSQISARKPLMLVFEDIQWMDSASVLLLDQLIHRVDAGHVLFVAACRSEADAPVAGFLDAAQEDGLLTRFELVPFTEEETMQFITQSGGREFSKELKQRIYRDTQGNAFLLVHLLGSLLEHGDEKMIPETSEEIMEYRLSGLSREKRKLLDLISMFPDYAPYEVLEHLSSQSPMDLLYICQELKGRSIISEMSDGGGLSLVFSQPEFREISYARIPALNRRILHLNIARELTRISTAQDLNTLSQIIYHYQQGGDELNALRYQIQHFKACILPMSTLNIASATAQEHSAGPRPYVLSLMEEMERKLAVLREMNSDTDLLDEMEQDMLYAKSCYCVFKGYYQLGVDALNRLLSMKIDEDLRDLAYEQMIFYGIQVYQTATMRQYIGKALDISKDRNPQRYAVNCRYYGFLLVMEGKHVQGRQALEQSLTMLRAAFPDCPEHAIQAGYAHNYIGESYRKQGNYQKAVQEYQRAIDMVLHYGPATSISIFYNNDAVACFAQGLYGQALELFQKSQEFLTYIEEPSGYRTISHAYLSLYAFLEGADKKASALIQRAEEFADALDGPYDQGIVLMMKAVLRSWCSQDRGEYPLTRALLDRPYMEYLEASRERLAGKAARFERELLQELASGRPVLNEFRNWAQSR